MAVIWSDAISGKITPSSTYKKKKKKLMTTRFLYMQYKQLIINKSKENVTYKPFVACIEHGI
jgi:hypothetical protein